MKFFAVILTAMVAATDAVPSAKSQMLAGSSIRGGIDQEKILAKAVRVNHKGERLLDQSQTFTLSSLYSLQFDKCVSLKAEPSDTGSIIFDDDLLPYTSKGSIVPQKSYILFNVCQTKYCEYATNDNLYMIDLDTYMAAIPSWYQEREANYCSACVDSYSYCK